MYVLFISYVWFVTSITNPYDFLPSTGCHRIRAMEWAAGDFTISRGNELPKMLWIESPTSLLAREKGINYIYTPPQKNELHSGIGRNEVPKVEWKGHKSFVCFYGYGGVMWTTWIQKPAQFCINLGEIQKNIFDQSSKKVRRNSSCFFDFRVSFDAFVAH